MRNEQIVMKEKKSPFPTPYSLLPTPCLFVIFCLLTVCSCANPFIIQILEPKTITFDTNGGEEISSQAVYKGFPVIRPPDPKKDGYTFNAWYSDNDTFEHEWDFDTVPASDLTLYAMWATGDAQIFTVTIDIEQIIKGEPILNDITISRTGTGYLAVERISLNAGDYDEGSIKWQIAGVGAYAEETITGTGAVFVINAENEMYNSIGSHILILEVKKSGVTYQTNIIFKIVY